MARARQAQEAAHRGDRRIWRTDRPAWQASSASSGPSPVAAAASVGVVRGVAGIERIVRSVGQSRLRDGSHDEPKTSSLRSADPSYELNCDRAGEAEPSMSARASTSAPQSGHLAGNGSRTSTANGD